MHHGLEVGAYRARWKLPTDHPTTAPAYSERRSTMTRQLGLGRKTGSAEPSPAPRRRVRRATQPLSNGACVFPAPTITTLSNRGGGRSTFQYVVMNSVFRSPARLPAPAEAHRGPCAAPPSEKRYLLSCVRFAGKGRGHPWSLRVRSDRRSGPGGVRCVRFVHMKRNVINFDVEGRSMFRSRMKLAWPLPCRSILEKIRWTKPLRGSLEV
jgi:hypothetical protein